MSKRSYSDQQKADALAALKGNGGNVKRTVQELKDRGAMVPEQTLRNWAASPESAPDIGALKQQAVLGLAEQIEKSALSIATKLEGATAESPSVLAVALGILVDKLLLLNGQPNTISRTESKPLTNEERADRVLELFESGKTKTA